MIPDWLEISLSVAFTAILVGLDRRVISAPLAGLIHSMVVLVAGGAISLLGVYFFGGIIPINSIVVPLSAIGLGMAIVHVLGTYRTRIS